MSTNTTAGKDTGTAGESTPRPGPNAEQREALRRILSRGAGVTLGTAEAREAWGDALPEMVAAVGHLFTAEELAIITEGAL